MQWLVWGSWFDRWEESNLRLTEGMGVWVMACMGFIAPSIPTPAVCSRLRFLHSHSISNSILAVPSECSNRQWSIIVWECDDIPLIDMSGSIQSLLPLGHHQQAIEYHHTHSFMHIIPWQSREIFLDHDLKPHNVCETNWSFLKFPRKVIQYHIKTLPVFYLQINSCLCEQSLILIDTPSVWDHYKNTWIHNNPFRYFTYTCYYSLPCLH